MKFQEKVEQEVEEKTDRLKKLLAEKNKYIDEILKSSQIKSTFMSKMSHELRTPLNVIVGFCEILLEGSYGDLNSEQKQYLQYIHSSSLHLLELINDILDISKIESGNLELNIKQFDLKNLITQLDSSLRPMIREHNLDFTIHWDITQSNFNADPVRLKEILYNLLDNAIKYTPEGKISFEIIENQEFWEFRVKDTGIGIAEEDLDLIFEDFRRTEQYHVKEISGTGLGLSLTKRLINLHGGEIEVESELGKGTTFKFTIPKNLKIT